VLEEKIMSKYSVEPLMAVGYEGFFGLTVTLTAQVLLHFIYGRTKDGRGGYFDMTNGWQQMIHSPAVLWSSVAIAASIALFNFFGLSVTRNISATARSTIDTCRTIGIWVASLTLGWEVFRPLSGGLQILGFILLCYGTLVSVDDRMWCQFMIATDFVTFVRFPRSSTQWSSHPNSCDRRGQRIFEEVLVEVAVEVDQA